MKDSNSHRTQPIFENKNMLYQFLIKWSLINRSMWRNDTFADYETSNQILLRFHWLFNRLPLPYKLCKNNNNNNNLYFKDKMVTYWSTMASQLHVKQNHMSQFLCCMDMGKFIVCFQLFMISVKYIVHFHVVILIIIITIMSGTLSSTLLLYIIQGWKTRFFWKKVLKVFKVF